MNFSFFSKSTEPPRCSFTKSHGHRCRMLPMDGSPFCFAHQPKPDRSSNSEELTIAELTEAAGELSAPEDIHCFLTRVTLLRIQGRLTPKEACAYAYLCQILQRGQREIAFHQKHREERAKQEVEKTLSDKPFEFWSLPRPDRSDPTDSTQPAQATEETPAKPSFTLSPSEGSVAKSSSLSALPIPPAADPTHTSVEISPPAQPVSTQTLAKSTAKPAPPARAPHLSPDFYNHFFPLDPTLRPGLQDHRKNIPPPDEAECRRLAARRGLLFNRRNPNLRGTLR